MNNLAALLTKTKKQHENEARNASFSVESRNKSGRSLRDARVDDKHDDDARSTLGANISTEQESIVNMFVDSGTQPLLSVYSNELGHRRSGRVQENARKQPIYTEVNDNDDSHSDDNSADETETAAKKRSFGASTVKRWKKARDLSVKRDIPSKQRTTTPASLDAVMVHLRRDAGSRWSRSRRNVAHIPKLDDAIAGDDSSNTSSSIVKDKYDDALSHFFDNDDADTGDNFQSQDTMLLRGSATVLDIILDDKTGRPTERLKRERAEKEERKLKKARRKAGEIVEDEVDEIDEATLKRQLLNNTFVPGGSSNSSSNSKPSTTDAVKTDIMNAPVRPGQVQIVIDAKGQIIIDENSTLITADEEPVVFSTRSSKEIITSRSFTKHTKNAKWTDNESRLFYRLLGKYGTDFGFMEPYFPTKTRAHIVSRYRKDNKNQPHLINLALKNEIDIDQEEFERVSKHYKVVKNIKVSEDLKLDVEALQAHEEGANKAHDLQEKYESSQRKQQTPQQSNTTPPPVTAPPVEEAGSTEFADMFDDMESSADAVIKTDEQDDMEDLFGMI